MKVFVHSCAKIPNEQRACRKKRKILHKIALAQTALTEDRLKTKFQKQNPNNRHTYN